MIFLKYLSASPADFFFGSVLNKPVHLIQKILPKQFREKDKNKLNKGGMGARSDGKGTCRPGN